MVGSARAFAFGLRSSLGPRHVFSDQPMVDWRLAKPGNRHIFSLGTADSRSGGVCHAGGLDCRLGARASPKCRFAKRTSPELASTWPILKWHVRPARERSRPGWPCHFKVSHAQIFFLTFRHDVFLTFSPPSNYSRARLSLGPYFPICQEGVVAVRCAR